VFGNDRAVAVLQKMPPSCAASKVAFIRLAFCRFQAFVNTSSTHPD
jgi:hypothetical protein